ncbi:MAG TPA: EamA family transporter [Alteromonas sp.]|nr:EamA family transporter [Alteromonas sp.]|tara:strand:+ start:1353 stop:2198 length:846 start_codon:yes stop_codon:yes gene_type:complete
MALIKLVLLAALAMTAFAANSLLCRMALVETDIDPASFTFWRLTSGALMLTLLVVMRNQKPLQEGNMASAIALFVYAAGFSFAYISMTTGAGALLLFGAVQVTMISWGLFKGERMSALQWGGFLLALVGLILLLLPNAAVPQLSSALMMLAAGIAWGVYSLKGKGAKFPIEATAGNFIRSTPLALVLLVIFWPGGEFHAEGMAYAVASGAIASALGYALWYSILVHIAAIKAATLQLSVPVLAVFAGWLFLDEPVTLRIILSSLAVIGGVAMVIWVKKAVA